jgi:hypothetical protein
MPLTALKLVFHFRIESKNAVLAQFLALRITAQSHQATGAPEWALDRHKMIIFDPRRN